MINEEKISDMFATFVQSGQQQGGQDIKQLYEVLPYLNQNQQRVLTLYRALAVKHDSVVIGEICEAITDFAKTNRKLGFRFTRLIESMALYKHFKGYQASASMTEEKK